MSRQLVSNYAAHLQDFVDFKRSDGLKYDNTSKVYEFDRFLHKGKFSSRGLPRQVWEKWSITQPGETNSTRYDKVCFLNQFSQYLNAIGKRSYISRLPKRPADDYVPYIYSPAEIKSLFKECDKLVLKTKNRDCGIMCIPSIIRLLYSTGLRLDEARSLFEEDVNLDENFIIVRGSKNRKQRKIPISKSLSSVCQEYKRCRTVFFGENQKSDYFFLKLNGKKCDQCIQVYFKKSLHHAGIRNVGEKKGPRLHDLRHTLAIRAFQQMNKKGISFFSALPTLSNYLGHQSLESTVYYLKLTAARFPDIINKLEKAYPEIIPTLENHYDN